MEYAITRFRSFWKRPTEAAKNEVKAPITETITRTDSLFSKKIEQRIIKKTPDTTSVAAWIKAETGVGPSIASGNQIWSDNCADFPRTPQKRRNDIIVKAWNSNPKNESVLFSTQGTRANAVE